jgi:hypothetical protein
VRRSVALVVSCMVVSACTASSALADPATGGVAAAQPPPPPPSPAAPPPPPPAAPIGAPMQGPEVPGLKAKVIKGVGHAPAEAPLPVKQAIWAANNLQGLPYKYGGGHATLQDTGYDCSGTVSYALHHAGLLGGLPKDSSGFMSWGEEGPGQWITVYTNPGHAFVLIAGLRLDTSAYNDRSGAKGPRWRKRARGGGGFAARHAFGF